MALNGAPISWRSCVTLSSSEAEYVAASAVAQENAYLRALLSGVNFHFLRERLHAGEIKLYKCWGPFNVADALTKSLPRPAFHKHAPFMHGTRSSYRPFTDLGA